MSLVEECKLCKEEDWHKPYQLEEGEELISVGPGWYTRWEKIKVCPPHYEILMETLAE